MTRSLLLLCLSLTSACTLNVRSFEREVPIPDDDPARVDRLRLDDATYPRASGGANIVVRGSAREDLTGTVTVTGLLGANVDPNAVAAGVTWDWPSGGDPVRELRLGYRGPAADTVRLERISLELPSHVGLDLSSDGRDVDVAGLDAMVAASTSFGAITVHGATEVLLESQFGAIDVTAGFGTIDAENGRSTFDFDGWIRLLGGEGDVSGAFRDGGEITTRTGGISVVFTGPLTRDLTIGSVDGPIDVTLPDDLAAELHVASQLGAESIRVGDVSTDQPFEGRLNGGSAFRIMVLSDRGAITVHRPEA
jgi:hypothetical protein